MIHITPQAASHIKELLDEQKLPVSENGLRILVEGGGCSGMQYVMKFDSKKPDDQVFSLDNGNVLIDSASLVFVDGSTLDYVSGLSSTGFRISNPKAKQTCGCGTSFEA